MIAFTVCKLGDSRTLQMPDGPPIALPTGHTIDRDMLDGAIIHLSPTGIVGVPMVMPDRVKVHPAKRVTKRDRAFEGSGALV